MMPLPDNGKSTRYVHSFSHNTGIGRTDGRMDGQTEMVKQYRTLRAVHADVAIRVVCVSMYVLL